MLSPSRPPNESARLEALRCYRILDSAPEREFDDIAKLAAYVTGMPIALVSLVDEHRQWFKARVGPAPPKTSREISFCAHAILEPGRPLIVEDPEGDVRFHDNPNVTGGLHIRYYAGIPLVTPAGHALGTLCVIDTKPNKLEEAQLDALARLARQVVSQLELRRNAIELAEARSVIHERDRALALHDILLGVAHEVNNPLTSMSVSVRSTLAVLRRAPASPDRDRLLVEQERILRGVERLTRVATTLRRITHPRPRHSATPFDLHALARACVKSAERRGVEMRVALPDSIAPVIAHEDEVRDVLNALLANALESLPPEGGVIEVHGDADADHVRLRVEDTGCGIDPAYHARIFTPFFTTKSVGTGLSLAIARRVVEDNGGRIWFDSTLGKGSTFCVELPRATSGA